MSQQSSQPGIQPLSITKKQWEVNVRDLLKNLSKAIVNASALNWIGAATDLVEVGAAVSRGSSEAEVAWRLIYKSLGQATLALLEDYRDLLVYDDQRLDADLLALSEQVDLSLGQTELVLDNHFFENPKQSQVLEAIKPALAEWLRRLVREPKHAETMTARLPTYFVYALHDEWRQNATGYAVLKERLDTPFIQAAEREQGWALYRAWLQKKVEEPMFLEAFGLKQVYVPLCAYYRQNKQPSENKLDEGRMRGREDSERVVVELEECLNQWLKQGDRTDAIRLISGGPGSGKSSFTKMWAAQLAEEGEIPTLYVQLHLIDATKDLIEAVGEFVAITKLLQYNPLAPEPGESRLLLIFDGLDELAMQGKLGAEAAQAFVKEVQTKVNQFNVQKMRLQVLMSGREVVVQASGDTFRKLGQILHLCPYFVSGWERRNYQDEHGLLNSDRRNDWWKKYGDVSGEGYTELPAELNQNNLTEITAQPLLNYLVALSYRGGRLNISEQSNLNEIYGDLLTAIYQRGWEDRQHTALNGVSQDQFERILEEVALSSWHGDGRTTTVKEIETHCTNAGMQKLLEVFQEGAKTGVTRLLTVFYFRQAGGIQNGEKTFEFTHKSFGEYLTARRVVRATKIIAEQLQEKKDNPDKGLDEKEALAHWARVCGASVMDEYLFRFVCAEVRLKYQADSEQVKFWQQTFCRLIEVMLRHGMPMERLDPRPSYGEESRQARNAEEGLLAVLNACARCTEELLSIKWQSHEAFGTWVSRLQGQRIGTEGVLALQCLNWLNLEDCILNFRDFCGASLVGASLVAAYLEETNLSEANLSEANLERANLGGANLGKALLEGANLERASLSKAYLEEAYLEEAYLEEADLSAANLVEANLEGANLRRAILVQTNLRRANLRRTNLVEANLEEANLSTANLSEANLKEANLRRAILKGASLAEANLRKAILVKVNLVEANLKGACLEQAILDQASLEEANLVEASLIGASLVEVDLDGARLVKANLNGANLNGASLNGASLIGASLNGASLIGASLVGTSLANVTWDDETRWDSSSLTQAIDVPQKLKQQLGLK